MDVFAASAAPSIPPLQTVTRLQSALSEAGIESVVGGSWLLASLGLIQTVQDWDLVIDSEAGVQGGRWVDPVPAVEQVLAAMGLRHLRRERSGIFRTSAALQVDAGDHSIDVLVGFALESQGRVVSIPARPGHMWQGLRMARPEEWLAAYRLMGRAERAEALQRHLGR
ncbi:hypothetical protein [Nesterenkonia sandarakina]|uniref:Nucleotidyltransferase family protein n=1 Tax=Nesterenkonia sandarakina TaxID=272918 RepID=A0A7Z0J2L1_9MICC|nr:hypothetical protein [Nesterenkonia sandarakina]NYJ16026.1 hypothetical protein [Nesterenkonia sandarakina]